MKPMFLKRLIMFDLYTSFKVSQRNQMEEVNEWIGQQVGTM